MAFEENEAATTFRSGCDKKTDEQRAAQLFCSTRDNTARLYPVSATSTAFARSAFQKAWTKSARFSKQPLCDVTKGSKMATVSVTTPLVVRCFHFLWERSTFTLVSCLVHSPNVWKLHPSRREKLFSKEAVNTGLKHVVFRRILATHTHKRLVLGAWSVCRQVPTCIANSQHLLMHTGQMNGMTDTESDLLFRQVPIS